MKERGAERGFTLVELMIVIGVIAILLGIYVGNAFSALQETRAQVCEKNRILYEDAEELFQHREGRPSASLQELVEKKYLTKATCPRGGVLTWEVMDPDSPNPHKTLVCSIHGHRTRIAPWRNPVEASGEQYAFEDGFDQEVPAGWAQVRGKYWEVVNGQLRAGRKGKGAGEHRMFSGNADWADYTVSTKATLHQGQGYGVYFRSTDPKKVDGYIFQYDPGYGRGAFLFRKIVNGRERGPFARVYAEKGYDWYGDQKEVSVKVKGDTFTAYIDGKRVLTGQDATYKRGGIGLRIWGKSMTDFDDVTVELDE